MVVHGSELLENVVEEGEDVADEEDDDDDEEHHSQVVVLLLLVAQDRPSGVCPPVSVIFNIAVLKITQYLIPGSAIRPKK